MQQGPGTLAEDFRYPLHRANSTMAILSGWPEDEARRLLAASLATDEEGKEGGSASGPRIDELMARVESTRREGYSAMLEGDSWNVAFPLRYRGRSFSVSLHGVNRGAEGVDRPVLECSLLVRRIEASLNATNVR